MTTRIRLIVAALLTLALAGLGPAHPTFAATGTQVADCSFATLQTDLQAGGDYYYAPDQCPNEIVATSTIVINTHASLTAQGKDIRIGAPAGMWQGYTQFFQVDGDFELTGLTLRGGNDQYTEASGGGAIFNVGTTTITDCTFWNNLDFGAPGAGGAGRGGGAIFNSGTMTIANSTFVGNSSQQDGADSGTAGGGAIENWEGSLTISNSTFSSNYVFGTGNYVVGSSNPDQLGYGGAVFNGVFDPSFAVTITDSTFYNNTVNNGLFTNAQLSGGPFIISGTIIDGGAQSLLGGLPGPNCDAGDDTGYIDMASLFIDKGNNLEDDAAAICGFSAAHHDVVGQDPQLGSLQYNGGPTQTRAPGPGSPAVDAIPVSSGNCPATDQRGTPRPDDGESACDIGAYEYNGSDPLPTTLSTVFGSGTYGGTATLTATLTAGTTPVSGETVSFTLNGTAVCGGSTGITCPSTDSNGVATLSGVSLSGIDAGIHSGAVGASFAGDSSYRSSTASGDLTVAQAGQSITFNPLPAVTYGVAPFTVSATGGGSTSPVTFTATGNCSASGTTGATISVTGAGSCTVTASQAGDSNYTAATSVSQTFTIAKASATITLDIGSLSATYDGNPHLATATTSPGGLSYSVSYTDGTGNPVTSPTSAGSYGVTATVTDPNYAGSTSGTLVIAKAQQSITVSGHAPSSATYGATFTVTATASSGLGVAYGSSGACSNTGATFTMTSGTGTCTVTYDQAGNGNYNAAGEVTETVTAQKAAQTLTFGSLANHTYGDQPVTVSASASSGLPVSFTVGSTDQCTISGSTVTITGAGSCTVTASQGGNGNYNAAPSVSQTFSIARAVTTTTLTSSPSPSMAGQSVTFTARVARAGGSAIPSGSVTFTDGSTTLGTATLSGGTATVSTSGLALGGHTITATYSGTSNYLTSASAALTQNVDTNLSTYPKLATGAYNLANATLSSAFLVNFNLAGATAQNATLSGANLSGANLTGANLSQATLSGATLSRANLTNANLSQANLKGATGMSSATLNGVIWSKTTCPDGTSSSQDGGTCVGHL